MFEAPLGIPDHVDELEPFLREIPRWIRLDKDSYLFGPGVGSSSLKTAQISLAHYKARHLEQVVREEESKALHIGTLCHQAILEGPIFRERFRVMAKVDKRTKDGKAYVDDFNKSLREGDIVVTEAECDMITGMIAAILADPYASGLLTDGMSEISGYAVDKETGILMKIRPDFLRTDGIIVDYKTTKDASPKWWPRQAADLGYHIQAGYYRMVANLINGTPLENRFVFIAQEKEPPYAVTTFVADSAYLERGEQIARFQMARIANAMKTKEWPGYSDSALSLSLPDWAMKDDEEILL